MQLLLAVLLYLNILAPDNTYYLSFIDAEEALLAPTIELVEDDPVQMEIVNDIYMPMVQRIIVADDLSGYGD